MNNKHTEGTWYAHDGQIYPEKTGKTLAVIPHFDKENEEQQANAHLISAAPELYETLKELINRLYHNAMAFHELPELMQNELINKGRRALAKAKGE